MTLHPPRERLATRERSSQAVLPPPDLRSHFLEVIQMCAATPATQILHRSQDAVEEIIYETEVGGVRYYLVRSRPQASERINLSPRELAIARLIAKGLPNKSIGDVLEISPWTVATHLRRIFGKLGVTSRAAMVARLVEEDLL
jgi:two-component system, NarL family, nitrate/nitrite response regulator NarL